MRGSAFDQLQEVVTQLTACLCAGLSDSAPCSCAPVEGIMAINDNFGDDCDQGMAWVRLASAYPCEATGEASTRKQNLKLGLGFDIEIGVERPMLLDEDDGTVSDADHATMVAREIEDMKACFQAVGCCEALKGIDVIVGTWTPRGPQGAVYGGQLTIFGMIP